MFSLSGVYDIGLNYSCTIRLWRFKHRRISPPQRRSRFITLDQPQLVVSQLELVNRLYNGFSFCYSRIRAKYFPWPPGNDIPSKSRVEAQIAIKKWVTGVYRRLDEFSLAVFARSQAYFSRKSGSTGVYPKEKVVFDVKTSWKSCDQLRQSFTTDIKRNCRGRDSNQCPWRPQSYDISWEASWSLD